jgi:hypothetical protein
MDPSSPTRTDFRRMFAPGPSNRFEHLIPKKLSLDDFLAGSSQAPQPSPRRRLLIDDEIGAPSSQGRPDFKAAFAISPHTAQAMTRG